MNYGLLAKRQAASLAYQAWIKSATGDYPNVRNHENGVAITWKPGQAEKMRAYILDSMNKEPSPDDLNVSVPWGEVLPQVALKKYWLYGIGGIAAIYLAGKLT